MKNKLIILFFLLRCIDVSSQVGNNILIEAESFNSKGGWLVDQQFVHLMGSPYLLAHGYGHPVENASTSVDLPAEGEYSVWVRTKDWVPDHQATPGMFKIHINGEPLNQAFGTNQGWDWVNGGKVNLTGSSVTLELVDSTGFEGRCDAIFLTTDETFTPPNVLQETIEWRRIQKGLSATPPIEGKFDLVIVGGGMSGTCAALAAARGGIKVALIQDRPVLGGNASEEIRVHTLGQVGYKIVEEVGSDVPDSGGDEFIQHNNNRQNIVDAESNIHQYLSTRAFRVNTDGQNNISSIDAKNVETGEELRFEADLFIDATGDGWIGYWAGAEYMIGVEDESTFNESLAADELPGKNFNLKNMMGGSLLWRSFETGADYDFPEVPWAMDVAQDYSATRNYWYWESGIGFNTIDTTEYVRDNLFRAIYGSFYNAKQDSKNSQKDIYWMGYVLGKRETRRLVGDYVLTQNDIDNATTFIDSVVVESRSIDVHYRDPQYPTYDWLSEAYFHPAKTFWIPFRSLYSKNINNLMMAGRCASFSHIGLGSPRVMNTCGQMGVATGCAAMLCKKYNTTPRGVYQNYMGELQDSVGIPRPKTLPAGTIYIDDEDEAKTVIGEWTYSNWSNEWYNIGYHHDNNSNKGACKYVFNTRIDISGTYKIYTKYQQGTNRSSNTPFVINAGDVDTTVIIDQRSGNNDWQELGTFHFNENLSVTIKNEGTDGYVIADVIAVVPENFDTEITNISSLKWSNIKHINAYLSQNELILNIGLSQPADVSSELYNITGSSMLQSEVIPYQAGNHVLIKEVNSTLPSGIYILKTLVGRDLHTTKIFHKSVY